MIIITNPTPQHSGLGLADLSNAIQAPEGCRMGLLSSLLPLEVAGDQHLQFGGGDGGSAWTDPALSHFCPGAKPTGTVDAPPNALVVVRGVPADGMLGRVCAEWEARLGETKAAHRTHVVACHRTLPTRVPFPAIFTSPAARHEIGAASFLRAGAHVVVWMRSCAGG